MPDEDFAYANNVIDENDKCFIAHGDDSFTSAVSSSNDDLCSTLSTTVSDALDATAVT